MTDEKLRRSLEEEIRAGRRFSLADVIGREGKGFFEGESAVPQPLRAEMRVRMFVARCLPGSDGVVLTVLLQDLGSRLATCDPSHALALLADRLDVVLEHPATFYDFVRRVDCEWGRIMQERPHFQRPGQPADPDDEHTHASVRRALTTLQGALTS